MGLFRRNVPEKDAVLISTRGMPAKPPASPQGAANALMEEQAHSFEASSDAVAITDPQGIIRYVNAPFSALTRFSAEEAVGKTPPILKSGKQDAFFYQYMWRHLLAGHTWHGEIVNRRRDGTLYVDDQTITPIKQNGSIGCFVSVRRDCTAEKRSAADELRSAEEATFPQKIEQIGTVVRSSSELLEKAVSLFLSLSEFQGWASGLAFEVRHDQRVLKLVVADGAFSPQFLADEATIPLGECLCGRAAVEGRVLICGNCYRDPRHEHQWLGMRAHGHYTIPLRTRNRVLAVVNLYTETDVDSSERRIAFLASAGFQFGAIMDRLLHRKAGELDGT